MIPRTPDLAPAILPSLLASLDAVMVREGRAIEVLERIDAEPLPSGRGQGVEFALDQCRIDLAALAQVRAALAQLAAV